MKQKQVIQNDEVKKGPGRPPKWGHDAVVRVRVSSAEALNQINEIEPELRGIALEAFVKLYELLKSLENFQKGGTNDRESETSTDG